MYPQYTPGAIEVITGPMFSGKSEEILKKLRILNHARRKVLVVKPSFDIRFGIDKIRSRAGIEVSATPVNHSAKILDLAKDYDAVIIDEAHFFDLDLVKVVEELANQGKYVVVSGLDTNFKKEPFKVIAKLLAVAEHITKLKAVCSNCQQAATTTFRTIQDDQENLLGDDDIYEARCRSCHILGTKQKSQKR
ncbi:thymidine kinase [Mycoplasmopsis agassizii]|uniref:Thymidine kinase n=1 Tax=Mycoplasmopsis agassizii TaxID=33922 RepID=A0ABX4H534_9BACT|nr:thymidine kinase [Mycoplasmopsis agassizii]PAF55008.1 thymidine kinase [Mycoplasmopsis agassizii]SMC17568.1 thymidine kinase [Mycoplasmopsis agassizii]